MDTTMEDSSHLVLLTVVMVLDIPCVEATTRWGGSSTYSSNHGPVR